MLFVRYCIAGACCVVVLHVMRQTSCVYVPTWCSCEGLLRGRRLSPKNVILWGEEESNTGKVNRGHELLVCGVIWRTRCWVCDWSSWAKGPVGTATSEFQFAVVVLVVDHLSMLAQVVLFVMSCIRFFISCMRFLLFYMCFSGFIYVFHHLTWAQARALRPRPGPSPISERHFDLRATFESLHMCDCVWFL